METCEKHLAQSHLEPGVTRLTLLSHGAQLYPHLLQGLLQVGAARALLLQGELHVAVLQRHGRLGLRRQRPVGRGAHVLPTAAEYPLERNGEKRREKKKRLS